MAWSKLAGDSIRSVGEALSDRLKIGRHQVLFGQTEERGRIHITLTITENNKSTGAARFDLYRGASGTALAVVDGRDYDVGDDKQREWLLANLQTQATEFKQR